MQKQGSMPRHSRMNVTAFILAETPMPQHSAPNAAALTLSKKKIVENFLEVSMLNAAAFTTQCRGIQITRENFLEISMFNAAAFTTQCRGIHNPMPRHSLYTGKFFY